MTGRARILVVEQPGHPADTLCRRLEALGNSIAGVVAAPMDAAELAPRLNPDLVLMGAHVGRNPNAAAQLAQLRERVDCPCLDALEEQAGHTGLAAADQILQLRLEIALRDTSVEREQRRADSAEDINRATARAIHEVNNLLSAIRCNAFLVQSEPISAAAVEAATDINAAVERSAALVQELARMLREQRPSPRLSGSTSVPPPPRTHSWPPGIGSKIHSDRATRIVLVVDDDPVVRRAVARFLASAGYQVIESSTPEQGLAAATRYPIDLMITDLVMPNMTGYELADRVAEIRPSIRVIYMSGFAPDELAGERAHRDGPDPIFLQKPFPVDALMPSVFAMLAEDKSREPSQIDAGSGLTSNKL